jgi:antitoxin (DNA-binding transcriptional repressor) of toxin-antitoxin stability system
MIQISVAQFSKKIDLFLNQVEEGKHLQLIRKGKVIAEIIPLPPQKQGWKRKIRKATLLKNVNTTELIEAERSLI